MTWTCPPTRLRMKIGGGEGRPQRPEVADPAPAHARLRAPAHRRGTSAGAAWDPADYVLAPVPAKERPDWDVTFEQAADVVEDIVTKGFAPTQMALHTGS